jgi:hypothetical protein
LWIVVGLRTKVAVVKVTLNFDGVDARMHSSYWYCLSYCYCHYFDGLIELELDCVIRADVAAACVIGVVVVVGVGAVVAVVVDVAVEVQHLNVNAID